MSASVAEQLLARIHVLLSPLVATVDRGRLAAYGEPELPAANLKRDGEDIAHHARNLQRHILTFTVEYIHAGADWETRSDAQHVQFDELIGSDAGLLSLGARALQLVATDSQGEEGDYTAGRLSARYQIQFITRPGDLTRAIT